MTKVFALLLFLPAFVPPAQGLDSLKPHGIYSDDIAAEIARAGEGITRVSLQNKPMAFASDTEMFDANEAKKIVDVLPMSLQVLDLSLNRLPDYALPGFMPLLLRPNFKYLDITVNSGADTLDGLRALTNEMGRAGIALPDQIAALKKVIWVRENNLDAALQNNFLRPSYCEAHRDYFRNWRQACEWRLP